MRDAKRIYVLIAALAAMAIPATTASAATAPGYGEWDQCRGRVVDQNITTCTVVKVTGGHLKMGTKKVPIVDPIELIQQGAPPSTWYVERFDGGRQVVPGGLVGITGLDWLLNFFPLSALKLYAETELAGTPGGPFDSTVRLPIKVKLENPLLSDSCYIGSNTEPIVLNLTKGTTSPPPPNQPISGDQGLVNFDPALPGVLRIRDAVLVDNSFAAPRARGCTMFLPGLGLIDPLVNLQAGLPSAAGTNEAVQKVNVDAADITAVYPPDGVE